MILYCCVLCSVFPKLLICGGGYSQCLVATLDKHESRGKTKLPFSFHSFVFFSPLSSVCCPTWRCNCALPPLSSALLTLCGEVFHRLPHSEAPLLQSFLIWMVFCKQTWRGARGLFVVVIWHYHTRPNLTDRPTTNLFLSRKLKDIPSMNMLGRYPAGCSTGPLGFLWGRHKTKISDSVQAGGQREREGNATALPSSVLLSLLGEPRKP